MFVRGGGGGGIWMVFLCVQVWNGASALHSLLPSMLRAFILIVIAAGPCWSDFCRILSSSVRRL